MPDFDWSLLSRPDLRSLVLGQLGFSWLELSGRLAGLTDEELLWAPAPGALSVVRRGETTRRSVGAGEWVAEWPEGPDDPGPRTIAWLLAHLTEVVTERWDWTFGEHRWRRTDLDVQPTAAGAVAALSDVVERWQRDIAALQEDELWTVGRSQATEIDQEAPFAHLVLHVNRKLVHHGAEVSVLRDLYRANSAA